VGFQQSLLLRRTPQGITQTRSTPVFHYKSNGAQGTRQLLPQEIKAINKKQYWMEESNHMGHTLKGEASALLLFLFLLALYDVFVNINRGNGGASGNEKYGYDNKKVGP
jgi:hypothetical protein